MEALHQKLITLLFICALLAVLTSQALTISVTLTWDPNVEPDVLSYEIPYGLFPDRLDTIIDVGIVTTYTVTTLKDDKVYYFAAIACARQTKERSVPVGQHKKTEVRQVAAHLDVAATDRRS